MDQVTQQLNDEIEQQRAQVEQQRAKVDRDLDAISDHVKPSHVAQRAGGRVRRRVQQMRDSVMGTVHDAGDDVSGSVHGAVEATEDAARRAGQAVAAVPERVEAGTRGQPLVAGVVAFGAGVVLGAVLPSTRSEQELARRMAPELEHAGDRVADELRGAADHVASDVGDEAQAAVVDVRETATEAARQSMATLGSSAGGSPGG